MKIVEAIVNVATGEETIQEREETVEEKQTREKSEAERKKRNAEAEAKAAARRAILDRLGLTEDEAKLLLG